MKNKKIVWTMIGFIAWMSSQCGFAGNRPEAVTITPGIAYYFYAGKRNLDNASMPNISLAYNFDQHWAVEGMVGVQNTNINPPAVVTPTGVHGFLYTVDGIYRFMPHKLFEPYVIAGVGVLGLKPNQFDSEHQGNVNAGIGAQYFMDPSIALRAEARDIYTMSGGKNDYFINFGVSFLFGGCCC